MLKSFPEYLECDIKIICEKLIFNSKANYKSETFSVKVNEQIINIPERIYFDAPNEKDMNMLTDTQKEILNCFYTRHYDGYIREEKMKSIISLNHSWIVPYVIKILGEYIIEILEVINNNIKNLNSEDYKIFINNNTMFFKTTESRVASYWDCYYRYKFPQKSKYVGFRLIKHFRDIRSK
jgi:hypothetical protein